MTETFYDVLGVAEDATTDEIEAAYRERLKQTHPDVSDDEDAGAATQQLIEARDVLVDEDERARYDRLGHEAYVGDGTPSASDGASETSQADTDGRSGTTGTDAAGNETRNRAQRERRARERVREERRRTREARQRRQQAGERTRRDEAATSTADDTASPGSRRAGTADPTSATATGNTYSVRENVAANRSYGPSLPTGRELTLLGISFALYPVLLFSALLPAFPPLVNLVLTACTLLLIIYLQSMPRVALPLFGGWSAISVVGLLVFGIAPLSALGLVILCATVLPFGFSVLTASALRY
ncbi:J domain-containing protein [Haloarcula laminariae]|uniref:J domain-containing protein n=1 Tax=Haloarcula laminariae TaxID=2961577 RepID=UPI0021CA0765|nr:DnaJ domain-containing protein [Halomicroarcula laminariae]